jgi:hypothetical protein
MQACARSALESSLEFVWSDACAFAAIKRRESLGGLRSEISAPSDLLVVTLSNSLDAGTHYVLDACEAAGSNLRHGRTMYVVGKR